MISENDHTEIGFSFDKKTMLAPIYQSDFSQNFKIYMELPQVKQKSSGMTGGMNESDVESR